MLISIFEKSSPASFIAYQTRSLTAPLQHMGQAASYNPMRRFWGKSCALHRVATVLHAARGKTGVYPTGSKARYGNTVCRCYNDLHMGQR